MPRVAVLFDNTVRPETTGFYVRRALGAFGEVEHFLPSEFDQLARGHHGEFDLFLAIDDGLSYELPSSLQPLAFWAIDTHVNFEQVLAKARPCRHVFAAQRNGASRLTEVGVENVVWLPLACDPDIHRPHPVPKEHDVAFVGNVLPGPRKELLDKIRERYPNTFVGQRYLEEMARTYSAARVVFNRSVADDVNMRVFEALGCGSALLTNDLAGNGLAELFEAGRHLATYADETDLFEKLSWLLTHEAERERIASEGQRAVLARHTYRHRVATMLETIESNRRTTVAPRSLPAATKPAPYYEFSRPEVLALVPESAHRVLDVGCGAGRFGEALKQRQPAEVVGIELDPEAARAAHGRLDEVLTIDLDQGAFDMEPGRFDCIVCADVLEHIRHPDRLVRQMKRWLTPDGCLVTSIPNVQHHSVVTSLLAGNFTYESAGLLDETHIRFLTRREIEKLFFRAGFTIERLVSVPGPGDEGWEENARAGEVDVGGLRVTGLESARVREFYTYQYLVVARPAPVLQDGLTSIVLATHNQLAYTRLCLDSVRRFTDEPYELIVVDNGSTDGTPDELRSAPDVRLIENAENRGFPAAVNQAIAAARGDQILLLNNDTLVTTGWLRRMLDALHSDPRIGLVGPVSNNVSGPQQVAVAYRQLADLDGFAWERGKSHQGKRHDLDRLVGFCLLVRRSVVDRIGLLDERFGIGNFEDDDYCRRALGAGFRCVVARDAFVHHFGGRTFAGSGIDFGQLMAENERKFREKWQAQGKSASATVAKTVSHDPDVVGERARSCHAASTSETDGLGAAGSIPPAGPPGSRPTLSLCMIVRDNEQTIVPCLESIRPFVDEMIVVDTGSTDRTPELCRALGAKVFHFPWCDDFSAARNQSLKYAGGEWIFWMDSDDTIPEKCGRKLRELADGLHEENVLGYVMQVHCPAAGSDGAQDVTIVDHVKLFRNRSDLRFEHRIHEQILPAIRRAGADVEFTDIYVIHSGSDHTPEGRKRKLERDFRLLELDLAERPDHPFVLFNLGMTYEDAGIPERAVEALEQCLRVSNTGESHVRKAYALLTAGYSKMGRFDSAGEACQRGMELFPADKELHFRRALLHQQAGRLREAEADYLSLLHEDNSHTGDCSSALHDGNGKRHFMSIDRGLAGQKARHNLALVYEELGDWECALAQWQRITAETANYLPAWHGLSRIVFERKGPVAAQPILKQLATLTPDDASVWHNLGAAQLHDGDRIAAERSLQRSLQLRPQEGSTMQLLSLLRASA